MDGTNPLAALGGWIEEARERGLPHPASVAFVTVGADGRPSARTVALKRLEGDALVFTTALWTRKASEIEANPHVALLFHWPSLGRQAHLTGEATVAERALSEELFAERDRPEYHPGSADEAWERTSRFLAGRLGPGAGGA